MSKTVPNFLFPTNFRNSRGCKRLIKDFNVQGYGIAVYLLETLAETCNHVYSLDDIDLVADEMKVSVPVVTTVITNYGIFEIVKDEEGKKFISSQLNKWLEPYYQQIEQRSMAGKISAAKRKQKQQEQLKQLQINLSENNSTQRPLNDSATIKEINKEINNKRKNLSSNNERENFQDFKESLLASKSEIRFTLPYPFENFLENTVIKLKKNGYLHNESVKKDLSKEQAFKVWEYMFSKSDKLKKYINEEKK